jgi:hypothetical protein
LTATRADPHPALRSSDSLSFQPLPTLGEVKLAPAT